MSTMRLSSEQARELRHELRYGSCDLHMDGCTGTLTVTVAGLRERRIARDGTVTLSELPVPER